jgi:hypothetical protein
MGKEKGQGKENAGCKGTWDEGKGNDKTQREMTMNKTKTFKRQTQKKRNWDRKPTPPNTKALSSL